MINKQKIIHNEKPFYFKNELLVAKIKYHKDELRYQLITHSKQQLATDCNLADLRSSTDEKPFIFLRELDPQNNKIFIYQNNTKYDNDKVICSIFNEETKPFILWGAQLEDFQYADNLIHKDNTIKEDVFFIGIKGEKALKADTGRIQAFDNGILLREIFFFKENSPYSKLKLIQDAIVCTNIYKNKEEAMNTLIEDKELHQQFTKIICD